ncbi:MAG: hypothetical protein E5V49_02240 [Mesorhizobium sp.]|nr:hypothetical protein EN848_07880 [bacterium M00.F.Ca.ET.205.01.1.1]TGU53964.1 hypothetical protein EN795_12305 [bacterium M00.F.Ca.ET.152.01.1.1]TGV37462.1 hypothetical protein EN829_012330 [Mesorhizobium sp. M00.F.Ca.ET.186.01.1.1]TGZ41177.1 hypothetical protein EN805_20520 [bacterium M00.F.Ca.ET.162.01.1.1]TJW34889.1 MAG: hypothetical protein E5V49_02240 [Mesorhizobium sp.]
MQSTRQGPPLARQAHARIVEILKAARTNDWDQFKTLSDGDLSNEESMRGQFNASRLIVDFDRIDVGQFSVGVNPDGFRLIVGQLAPLDDKRQRVVLTVYSKELDDGPFISVWTFHEGLDLSSL